MLHDKLSNTLRKLDDNWAQKQWEFAAASHDRWTKLAKIATTDKTKELCAQRLTELETKYPSLRNN